MKKNRNIKLFTHDDLDGYAAEIVMSLMLKKKYKLHVTHLSNEEVNKEIGKFVNDDKLYENYRFIFIIDICPTDVSIIEKIKERNYHYSYGQKIFIFDHHKTAYMFNSKNEGIFVDNTGDECGTYSLYYNINSSSTPELEIFVKKCIKHSYIKEKSSTCNVPVKKSNKLSCLNSFIYDVYNWDTFAWKEYDEDSVDGTSAYNLNLLFKHYIMNGNNTRFGDFVKVISRLIKNGIYECVMMNDNFITLERKEIEKSYNILMEYLKYYHSKDLDTILILGHSFKVIPCSEKDNVSVISDTFYEKLKKEDRPLIALLFIFPLEYTDNGMKYGISLRSSGDYIDVSEVAKTIFNGGGHFNASGGTATINELRDINLALPSILEGEVYQSYLNMKK